MPSLRWLVATPNRNARQSCPSKDTTPMNVPPASISRPRKFSRNRPCASPRLVCRSLPLHRCLPLSFVSGIWPVRRAVPPWLERSLASFAETFRLSWRPSRAESLSRGRANVPHFRRASILARQKDSPMGRRVLTPGSVVERSSEPDARAFRLVNANQSDASRHLARR